MILSLMLLILPVYFYQGNNILSRSFLNTTLKSLARCEIPKELTTQREIQKISFRGRPVVSEIQALEVTAMPNQKEVQQIKINFKCLGKTK